MKYNTGTLSFQSIKFEKQRTNSKVIDMKLMLIKIVGAREHFIYSLFVDVMLIKIILL
jgi:hypothetical protein